MDMQKNAVSWFEIPVKNFDKARQFYQAIFDFDMPEMQMGPNRMGILLHEQGAGVGGAIVAGEWYEPNMSGTMVYLSANPDLSAVLERVGKADGNILVPKTNIGDNMGYFAIIQDCEGNRVGLHSVK
jgi:predicted enzyme related to lactoylglutathione lyase